jgi:hypothetical protein
VLACQIQRNVVGIRDRIEAGGALQQSLHALEVLVNDAVDEGRVVVMVNQVDRLGCGWG